MEKECGVHFSLHTLSSLCLYLSRDIWTSPPILFPLSTPVLNACSALPSYTRAHTDSPASVPDVLTFAWTLGIYPPHVLTQGLGAQLLHT